MIVATPISRTVVLGVMSCEALVGEGRSRTCENEGQFCMCICMLSTSELLQESVAIYMFEIVCIACNVTVTTLHCYVMHMGIRYIGGMC